MMLLKYLFRKHGIYISDIMIHEKNRKGKYIL